MAQKGVMYQLKLRHVKNGWTNYDEYDTRDNAVDIGRFKLKDEPEKYLDFQVNKIKI